MTQWRYYDVKTTSRRSFDVTVTLLHYVSAVKTRCRPTCGLTINVDSWETIRAFKLPVKFHVDMAKSTSNHAPSRLRETLRWHIYPFSTFSSCPSEHHAKDMVSWEYVVSTNQSALRIHQGGSKGNSEVLQVNRGPGKAPFGTLFRTFAVAKIWRNFQSWKIKLTLRKLFFFKTTSLHDRYFRSLTIKGTAHNSNECPDNFPM